MKKNKDRLMDELIRKSDESVREKLKKNKPKKVKRKTRKKQRYERNGCNEQGRMKKKDESGKLTESEQVTE